MTGESPSKAAIGRRRPEIIADQGGRLSLEIGKFGVRSSLLGGPRGLFGAQDVNLRPSRRTASFHGGHQIQNGLIKTKTGELSF
jgi:hypothetical protein